jgi:hypothetical protein
MKERYGVKKEIKIQKRKKEMEDREIRRQR